MDKHDTGSMDGEVQLPHQTNDIKPDDIIEPEQDQTVSTGINKEIAPPPPAIEEEDLPTEYHRPDPPAKIRKGPITRLRGLFSSKKNIK